MQHKKRQGIKNERVFSYKTRYKRGKPYNTPADHSRACRSTCALRRHRAAPADRADVTSAAQAYPCAAAAVYSTVCAVYHRTKTKALGLFVHKIHLPCLHTICYNARR